MANVDSRNGKAELATCQRILEREQSRIALQRMMLRSSEKNIALILERILHVKRRICELEKLIASRIREVP